MNVQDRPVVVGLLSVAGGLMLNAIAATAPGVLDLNSNLFTSLIGALAGAFAGAYGGQLIVERSKTRDELLKEMRNTNAAIMLAFGICNTALSLKQQHVKGLKENFDRKRTELEQHLKKISNSQPSKFYLDADFDTIEPISAETDALRTQIFERLSVGGRLIGLLTALIGTVQRLNDSLENRNALIAEIQAQRPLPEEVLIEVYFGLQQSWRGTTDKRYADYIDNIYHQLDDCIFFSRKLTEDLVEHGLRLKKKWEGQFRGPCPNVTSRCSISPKRSNYTQTRSGTPSGSLCLASTRGSKNEITRQSRCDY